MKKNTYFYLTIIFLFFLSKNINPQSGWVQLNSGTTKSLEDIFFINQNTGFACGDSIVLKTSNSGLNWIQTIQPDYNVSVFFLSINTGYITTYNGYIFKTTNTGVNWFQIYSTICGLFESYFKSSDTGYVVGGCGDFLITTNGGYNWFLQSFGGTINNWSIYFLNSNTGFIASQEITSGGRIYKTTNGGLNWFYQVITGTSTIGGISFANNNTGYAVGSTGATNKGIIVRTTNTGNSWYLYDSVSTSYLLYDIKFLNNHVGYATGFNGMILKTTNGGNNWFTESSGTNSWLSQICNTPNALYISGSNGVILKKDITVSAHLNNIYRPDDGRTQFANITLNDSLCTGPIDTTIWYVNDSLVSRQHTFTYPYRQGTTFVKLRVKSNHGTQDSATASVTRSVYKKYTEGQILAGMSLIGDSILYAISTGNAVYRLDYNGNPIYTLSVGGSVLSSCSIGYDTTVFIGSSDNNLYGFNKNGVPLWTAIPLGASINATPTIDSISNRIYIGVSNGNFFAINKSTGGVPVWSYFLNAPVRSSAVISNDRKLFVTSAIGTLYGFNLNNANPNPPSWVMNLNDSILVSPAVDSSGYFYFGSQSGKLYKVALTGTSTVSIIWQIPLGSAITTSPVIDVKNNVYVGTANGRLYSITAFGGMRWFFQTPAAIKATAAITPYQRIYFGNDAGEIYGLDTNKIVRFYYIDSAKISCAMLYHKSTLYFGNEAGRIFALFDSTGGSKGPVKPIWGTFQNNVRRTGNQSDGGQSIGIRKMSENIPDKFELYQNYPNPFNPMTNVQWTMSKSSNVKIVIYDVLGRDVFTLVNEKLGPGKYSADFDGNAFASGVYFYKIIAGDFEQVRKMILLK